MDATGTRDLAAALRRCDGALPSRGGTIRIAFLLPSFSLGGTERQILELIRLLDRGSFSPYLFVLREEEGGLAQDFHELEVPCRNLGLKRIWGLKGIRRTVEFAAFLRREKIQVVQGYLFSANLLAVLAGRLANTPIVSVGIRNLDDWKGLKRRLGKRLYFHLSSLVVTNSLALKDRIVFQEKVPKSKVAVIHNGVDLKRFTPSLGKEHAREKINLPKHGFVFGTVGSLTEKKGHTFLFQAFQKLFPKYPEACLVLAGEGSLREKLEEEARKLGLSPRVFFLGARRDIPRCLEAFDLFVLPSVREGLPNVLLEAQAMEKAVVASDVGGVNEIIEEGKNGLIVPPADPKALATALESLMLDPSRRLAMGKEGRIVVERRYSLDALVSSSEKLYREEVERIPWRSSSGKDTSPRKAKESRDPFEGGKGSACPLCGKWETHPVWKEGEREILQCTFCRTGFLFPPSSAEERGKIYSKDYFLSNYGPLLEKSRLRFRKYLQEIRTFKERGDLLDVGCGLGIFLSEARSAGFSVVGLETARFAAAETERGLRVPVILGSLLKAPLEEGSFDIVTLWDVIEHLEEPGLSLKKIRRLLRKHGLLVIKTPNVGKLLFGFARWARHFSETRGLFHTPSHLFFFNPQGLSALLEREGFRVLKVRLVDEIKGIRRSRSARKAMGMKAFLFFGRILGFRESFVLFARKEGQEKDRENFSGGNG